MRAFVRTAFFFFLMALACTAMAKKKPKEKPLKTIPGGANQKWACEQLAENACDLAKRCDPDYSLRRCKKLRDRCSHVKERPSRTATEDDVSVCAASVNDLGCKQVSFDNTYGVKFELKKLDTCGPVAKDDPMPAPQAGSSSPDDADDDKDTKKKPSGDDDGSDDQ